MKTTLAIFTLLILFALPTAAIAQTFEIASDVITVQVSGKITPSVAASLVPAKVSSTVTAGSTVFTITYAGTYTLSHNDTTETFKNVSDLRKALRALFKTSL